MIPQDYQVGRTACKERRLHAPIAALTGLLGAGIAVPSCADDLGLYAGASFVQSTFDHDWNLASGEPVMNIDDEDQGFKVLFGWRPVRWFALEASYADLGAASGNTSIVCAAAIGFPCPTELAADVRSSQVAALGLLPLGAFDLFARAGLNYWRADARIADGATVVVRDREHDTDVVYGVGAQYRYQRVGLRLEYENITLGDSDADTVSVGVTYNF